MTELTEQDYRDAENVYRRRPRAVEFRAGRGSGVIIKKLTHDTKFKGYSMPQSECVRCVAKRYKGIHNGINTIWCPVAWLNWVCPPTSLDRPQGRVVTENTLLHSIKETSNSRSAHGRAI